MELQDSRTKLMVFLAVCVMGAFAILSSTMSKSPVLNPFATYLGTPPELIGFVAAASTVPGILVSLPAASLSDIVGRRKFLLFAGFVFASAPFLYLFITLWWQLILVRFYHGFATAIFVPVAEASIAELYPTKRGERISLFTSLTYVGRLIAPTLGGYILFVTSWDYHVLYLAVAAAGVTAFILALPFAVEEKRLAVDESRSTNAKTEKLFQGWRHIPQTSVLLIALVQACVFYVYGSLEYFLAGYFKEVAQIDAFSSGIILSSIIFVAIFVRPYMGRFSDRAGRRVPIIAGCLISGLPLAVIPFVYSFWTILLLVVVYAFGFATVTAATPALISEFVPKGSMGTAMGFLDTVMDVGQTLGPIISGFLFSLSPQYLFVFPSLTVVLFAAGVVFALSNLDRAKSLPNAAVNSTSPQRS
jgi:MFS family permease